jgi:hypothetical protein
MPKKKNSNPRLTAEERLIEEKRAEVLRRKRELEQRLVKLPAAIAENQRRLQLESRERARRASPAISSGRVRSSSRRSARRPSSTPARQARAARVQALALLALLALILFLVWRAIPAS